MFRPLHINRNKRRKITDTQRRVRNFIVQHIEDEQMPPTRQEICDHFGWASPNASDAHLKALEAKRHIELIAGKARGIRVL